LKTVDYRGALRLLILYSLKKGPKHGYEIMKELESLFGKAPGPGALYPQLRYLKQKGLVIATLSQRGGKKIKVYSLTDEGLKYLEENKEELEKILRHIQGAKALLDMGLKRLAEDIAKTIKVLHNIDEDDRRKLREILESTSKEIELILSKYS